MLYSMTGYGRASNAYKDKTISVEMRSLNSKFMDTRFRVPATYKEKEGELKRMIANKLHRGKIDLLIETDSLKGEADFSINRNLFKAYYRELSELSDELGVEKSDFVASIMRIPNVVGPSGNELDQEEWKVVVKTIGEALKKISDFREVEGKVTEDDLRERVESIMDSLSQVPPLEKERIEKMRQRLKQNLDEYLGSENVDKNRFEQEIIFYIEKIDISEEKSRLAQHCEYFLQQLDDKKNSQKGRKLSFIGQEMGREINTLGAKAYSSGLQRLVVKMKDDLEKIKEQVANVV